MKTGSVFTFLVVCILSCSHSSKQPKNVLEKEKMLAVVWDMTRADAFITGFAGKNDSAFNQLKESVKLYEEIFSIHNTNREEFTKSLNWYKQNPELMKSMLDSIHSRQNRIIQRQSQLPSSAPVADGKDSIPQ